MATYDVYRHPDGLDYLLDIQSDVLSGLDTRLAVPLIMRERAPIPAKKLNPLFSVDDAECVMMTEWMGSVRASLLSDRVANLADRSVQITDAVDFLLHGY